MRGLIALKGCPNCKELSTSFSTSNDGNSSLHCYRCKQTYYAIACITQIK